jgi:hypothetical protein
MNPPTRTDEMPTAKEIRSSNLTVKLTGWPFEKALDFVRMFEWHITQYPGGVEGLIKAIKQGELDRLLTRS